MVVVCQSRSRDHLGVWIQDGSCQVQDDPVGNPRHLQTSPEGQSQ